MKECITHHNACDCREEKIKKLVLALKFYADGDSWSHTETNKNNYTNLEHDKDLGEGDFDISDTVDDNRVSGLRARIALKEWEE